MATRVNLSDRPPPFEPSGDAQTVSVNWKAWIEEFEAYADSIGLFVTPDDETNKQQRRALLLYTAGREVREIFQGLTDTGTAKEYDKAVRKLNTHFTVKTNATFQRHKFRRLAQTSEETVAQFVSRLRKNTDGCEFHDVNISIRDQVVEKCRSEKLQRKFLDKGDTLTLDELLKVAAHFEDVEMQLRDMKLKSEAESVAFVKKNKNTKPKESNAFSKSNPANQPRSKSGQNGHCYRCGGNDHYGSSPRCPARGMQCQTCNGYNHTSTMCRSKGAAKNSQPPRPKQKSGRNQRRKGINQVDLEEETDEEEDVDYVFMTKKSSVRENKITIGMGGIPVKMIIDSGCDTNIISENLWKELKQNGLKAKPQTSKKKLYPYSSTTPLATVCSFNTTLEAGENQTDAEIVVVKEEGDPLLSRETSIQLKVLKIGLNVQNVTQNQTNTKMQKVGEPDKIDQIVQNGTTQVQKVGEPDKTDKTVQNLTKPQNFAETEGEPDRNVQSVTKQQNHTKTLGEADRQVENEEQFQPLYNHFGRLEGRQVQLSVNPEVKPAAQPVRRTPFGLRDKVEAKIQDLLDLDIIEPVENPTPWVSPIVVVPKPNGDIRITVDMRRVNEAVLRERHPIPTVEELLQDMSESRIFTKLDLKMGYHQLELHPDSRDITTFVTHCGLFRYKRLVMGINAASEIYQHEIQKVVQGIPGVANLSDDIIVHAKNMKEHDERLRKTLQRLLEAGLTLNAEKCRYRKDEIEFLGHKLTAKGLDPARNKVEAIINAREPQNVSEVRSFLGLANYCARFIPNYATLADPLRKLTRKNQKFDFGPEQRKAFNSLKEAMSNTQTLGFYDVNAKTKIITDASPVGLGAVLIQVKGDTPRVVYYASRSLSDVERRYSQTEKEALAIVWAVERFHPYIYGIDFDLLTDHKPLQTIYGPRSKPSARIERWVLRLQGYTFKVIYIPGKSNIADPLSRLLPQSTKTGEEFDHAEAAERHVNFIAINAVPNAVKMEDLKEASRLDPELIEVRNCIQTGQWENCNTLYAAISNELCSAGDLVLRGARIIIPEKLRPRVLALAHEGHLGIVGTKQNLRTKVWWPGLEKAAEKYVKSCHGCQLVSQPNPPEPVKSTTLPDKPWEHLAIDFLGPLKKGYSVLVVIDYYSRYFEIAIMKSTTAEKTISNLKIMFARHGNPLSIHSDNGAQFISETFANYLETIGAEHTKVTPRWPQANGEVERQNRSLLKRMKIAQAEGKDWKEEILSYLVAYRANPHPSTGKSPAELLFGRKIRTKMPQLTPEIDDLEVRDHDAEKKGLSRLYADAKRNARESDIAPGDTVLLRRENPGKLETPFFPEPHQVISKAGSKVTVQAPSGATYSRNSTWVKKYATHDPELQQQTPQASQALQTPINPRQPITPQRSSQQPTTPKVSQQHLSTPRGSQQRGSTTDGATPTETSAGDQRPMMTAAKTPNTQRPSEAHTPVRPQRVKMKSTRLKDFVLS